MLLLFHGRPLGGGILKHFLKIKKKKQTEEIFQNTNYFQAFTRLPWSSWFWVPTDGEFAQTGTPPRRGRILGVPVERFRLVFLYSVGTWRLLSKALCVFGTEECLEKGGGGRGEEERPSLNNRREENCAGPPKHLSV